MEGMGDMSKKKLSIENRQAPRYNPEPDKAEEALFFKNEITIKFPCDEVEREITDLSETGLKVFLEDSDPLLQLVGQTVKALLNLNKKKLSLKVKIVHQTEDDYGLAYMGCRFEDLSKDNTKVILKYLETKKG